MAAAINPIVREAAGQSARSLMAQVLPELEKLSATLDRAGERDEQARVDELRSTFVIFMQP